MTGFVTTKEKADAVTAGIEEAQRSKGLEPYWTLRGVEIHTGELAGSYFIPASDEILATPLRGYPVTQPTDFPEFTQLVEFLGGLDARLDVDPLHIQPPTFVPAGHVVPGADTEDVLSPPSPNDPG